MKTEGGETLLTFRYMYYMLMWYNEERGSWLDILFDFGADPVGVSIGVGVTFLSTQYLEPVVGFLAKFHGYIIGT